MTTEQLTGLMLCLYYRLLKLTIVFQSEPIIPRFTNYQRKK